MKYLKNDILNIFKDSIDKHEFIKGVFSNPTKESSYKKINLKPVQIKGDFFIQFESFINNKAFHKNETLVDSFKILDEIIDIFKQILIVTSNQEIQILQNKKGFSIKRKHTENKILKLSHNKQKNYILQDNTPVPFLIELGVMSETGKVSKEKFNKFRQINRYLEFIEDTLKELHEKKTYWKLNENN